MKAHYLANLPWYDNTRTRSSLNRLWSAIAEHLRSQGICGIPTELERQLPYRDLWHDPKLLLSQCCGPDLFTPQGGSLVVISRPVFSSLSCTPGCYYSHIVASKHFRGNSATVVVNALSSRSGHGALIDWVQQQGIEVSNLLISGSHLHSLEILSANKADLAAIDAHLINQLDLQINLPVIGKSHEALSPPFVFNSNTGVDTERLRMALTHAISTHGGEVGIDHVIPCDKTDYPFSENACSAGKS